MRKKFIQYFIGCEKLFGHKQKNYKKKMSKHWINNYLQKKKQVQ